MNGFVEVCKKKKRKGYSATEIENPHSDKRLITSESVHCYRHIINMYIS
jgi:hypothetical protein